jgi:hypothetical protein
MSSGRSHPRNPARSNIKPEWCTATGSPTATATSSTRWSEKAVRLAQKMHIDPCIPVGNWECSYKRLKLAQLLGQLGVFLTCRATGSNATAWSAPPGGPDDQHVQPELHADHERLTGCTAAARVGARPGLHSLGAQARAGFWLPARTLALQVHRAAVTGPECSSAHCTVSRVPDCRVTRILHVLLPHEVRTRRRARDSHSDSPSASATARQLE